MQSSMLRQRGVALVIGLLLLLAITLLAMAGMRGTNIQERMVSNLYDRELIFQIVEAGMREAEAILDTSTEVQLLLARPGFYPMPVAAAEERWTSAATVWAEGSDALEQLGGGRPEYIVEYMGYSPSPPGCDRGSTIPQNCLAETFRITARVNLPDRAGLMLQTLYRR